MGLACWDSLPRYIITLDGIRHRFAGCVMFAHDHLSFGVILKGIISLPDRNVCDYDLNSPPDLNDLTVLVFCRQFVSV